MGRSADVPRGAGPVGASDADCTILHVDMDAFFASVEVRRRPELRGRPVLVGGEIRGVVAAASYEARRYGVRSAMSMAHAKRLCPQAVVLPPDRAAYSAASDQVMAILCSITPVIEPLSLDEAFLDVSGAVRRLGRPAQIAAIIRDRVCSQLGLSCSVGVASSKFIAKLASARCKPDGLLVVPADAVLEFLHPLPVTVLWGVGQRTAEPLHRLGIRTVGDLSATPIAALRRAIGDTAAVQLAALAAGKDARPLRVAEVEKSISAECTTDLDLVDETQVNQLLLRLATRVAERMRSRATMAKTVGIKIRFADFRTVTRVRTLPTAIDSTILLHYAALDLFRGLRLDQPRIRLVGVKAEGLSPSSNVVEQLSLDGAIDTSALDRAADGVKAKFGADAVGFATLLRGPRQPGQPSSNR